MKKQLTEQQIAFALRQASSGTAVTPITRKMGISEGAFYSWKKRFGDMDVAEVRRLKRLEEENRQLERLMADLTFDGEMPQYVLSRKL